MTFRRDGYWLKRRAFFLLVVSSTLHVSAALARGPWRADEGNTSGWALMTPEERIEHQATVRGFTNYEDCHAYQVAHHQLMEERAEQRGLPPPGGGHDFCARLRPAQEWGPE